MATSVPNNCTLDSACQGGRQALPGASAGRKDICCARLSQVRAFYIYRPINQKAGRMATRFLRIHISPIGQWVISPNAPR